MSKFKILLSIMALMLISSFASAATYRIMNQQPLPASISEQVYGKFILLSDVPNKVSVDNKQIALNMLDQRLTKALADKQAVEVTIRSVDGETNTLRLKSFFMEPHKLGLALFPGNLTTGKLKLEQVSLSF